jgi:hypothetical protein
MSEESVMGGRGGVRLLLGACVAVVGGLLLLVPSGSGHAQGIATPGLVTCTSFFQRFAVVLVREGFVSYARGTAGCGAPQAIDNLSDAERADIGTLSNRTLPGSPFSDPASVPPSSEILNLISGATPPVFFTSAPIDGQNQTGGPSTVGQDIGLRPPQQPASPN